MEGVRILNEISPMSAGVWFRIGVSFLVGIIYLIYVLTSSWLGIAEKIKFALFSLLPFLVGIALFFSAYIAPMKYEAIIDDDVKMSEFEEKYKIIKKRGDIYVIEEIENGN